MADSADTVTGSAAGGAQDGPGERGSVIVYLSRYKGVGARTATAVVDAFGPHEVFHVMDKEPERVRALIGPARAQMLLDGWAQDPEADARR